MKLSDFTRAVLLGFLQAKNNSIIPRQASGMGCVAFSTHNLYVYIRTGTLPTQQTVFGQ